MYKAYITRLKNVRSHSNADRLKIAECFGNTVVVGLDMEEGELGIYFPTDGQLSEEFAEVNNLVRKKDEEGNNIGGYLEPNKRNIRAIKLRGEQSDGLFLRLESLSSFTDIEKLKEGDAISEIGGKEICRKYVPEIKKTVGNDLAVKKILYPYFKEHTDTGQFMYNLKELRENELCYILLKMHGTSGRTSFTIKEDYKEYPEWVMKVINTLKLPRKKFREWEYALGSRRVVLDNAGYATKDEPSFRLNAHEKFVGKLQKGETAYYEIVGYEYKDLLIMPRCSNKKMQDKEFVKEYGETTEFTYGCENGESEVYVYRMTMTNEDGYEIEYPWEKVKIRCDQMGIKYTPEIAKFLHKSLEETVNIVEKHTDGRDPIGETHIREGVVLRLDNRESFKALKHKSFDFKVIEGIIKDSGVVDTEENESLKGV